MVGVDSAGESDISHRGDAFPSFSPFVQYHPCHPSSDRRQCEVARQREVSEAARGFGRQAEAQSAEEGPVERVLE
eukprot:7950704-Pyramimonas_sp.AAC.1